MSSATMLPLWVQTGATTISPRSDINILQPFANDGVSLGASGTAFSDLFLASGSVINFSAGDVTITHSLNALSFAGASTAYSFDAPIRQAAGAVGAPSYSFTTSTNSGMYDTGSNIIGFSSNGTLNFKYDATNIYAGQVMFSTIYGGTVGGRTDASALIITGGAITTTNGLKFNVGSAFSKTTAGTQTGVLFDYSGTAFAPTSGSANFNALDVEYAINQTGGASGTITGIFTNATETALVGTHKLMDLKVSNVSKFSISNSGVVNATSGGIRTIKKVNNIAVGAVPTDAELDTAFGDPIVVGSGFVGMIDDNDAGTNCVLCWTTGSSGEWFFISGVKAT